MSTIDLTRRRWLISTALAALLPALPGCAGYMVGADTLYPPDIRTIYVPMFESNSFRRNLGEKITEAVIKEIELKTPFKVVSTPDADSILTGRLVSETKRIVVESPTDESREVEVNFRVIVEWTNRRTGVCEREGEVPVPNMSLPAIADAGQTASFQPEIGQSVATAQDKAIQRLAEQIVGLMETPW